jgi:hypothetical protein
MHAITGALTERTAWASTSWNRQPQQGFAALLAGAIRFRATLRGATWFGLPGIRSGPSARVTLAASTPASFTAGARALRADRVERAHPRTRVHRRSARIGGAQAMAVAAWN